MHLPTRLRLPPVAGFCRFGASASVLAFVVGTLVAISSSAQAQSQVEPLPSVRDEYFEGAEPTFIAEPDFAYGGAWNADAQPQWSSNGNWEAPSAPSGLLTLDTPLMSNLLNFQNMQTRKEADLILNQAYYDEMTFIVGGQLRASGIFASTNQANKFPYQGRFPTDFTGTTASDLRLLQGNVAGAMHVSPWISGYFETLFSDVFTFPDFKQGSFQVRQAYVTVGNFDESPFYGYIGKKNVGFGDMRSLSPFTQAMTWHYFAALAEGGGIGFRSHGFDLTVAALNSGRGIRVTRAGDKGHLGNFAANASYTWTSDAGDLEWQLGGGYLDGTIYNLAVPDHVNFNAVGPYNPAWDVNANLRWGRFLVSGEYVQTVDPWPSTNHAVIAYRVEGAVLHAIRVTPAKTSISWSEGIQGPAGSEFEFNRQLVLGTELVFTPNVRLALEYVRSSGFAPLINIATVSDRGVVQNTALVGLTVVF
ncbi:MAG: hypothetical protein U0939_04500 [Pirellulales bacterium]